MSTVLFKKMKLSLSWLKDFIDLKEQDPQKIEAKLTESIAEVDGLEDFSQKFDKILIGEILEIYPHPEADKIQITKTIADKERTIICGATNIKVGQKIPTCIPGAKIGDFVIGERKMRGVMSEGMLCSERELGISDEGEGIMILDSDLKVGEPFAKSVGLDDIVFEIDNTAITNRPDLFAQYGFARELVSAGLAEWKDDKKTYVEQLDKKSTEYEKNSEIHFNVEIKDPTLCTRWCGIEIEGVQIEPSPDWIQKKLLTADIRPINNIVDITNYVMLELGMPMHAFDKDKIVGTDLTMRESKKGEKITSLDDKVHELDEGVIVFEDGQGLFDLCGLMGGASSCIEDTTTNLLIHAPIYDPVKIRRNAIKLNHRTDAAVIYEKTVPNSVAMAGLMLTVKLIEDLCPEAKVVSKVKDIKNYKDQERIIDFDITLITRMIGKEIPESQIRDILENLGFEIDTNWNIKIPSFRHRDIEIPEDIAEEVVRMYGLNNIVEAAPSIQMSKFTKEPKKALQDKLSQKLVEHGFCEVINFAFLGEELLAKCSLEKNSHTIEVLNPISSETELMRQDLLPRILENAEKNIRHKKQFALFECGKIFNIYSNTKEEKTMIQGLMVGTDFYTTKNIINNVLSSPKFKEAKNKPNYAHKARVTDIYINKKLIGQITELSNKIIKNFDLPETCTMFSIDLDTLSNIQKSLMTYSKIARFPSVEYDVSFLVPEQEKAQKVLLCLDNLDKLIIKKEIIEIYQGKSVPENMKSITLGFEFRANDRTLEEKDIKLLEEKIISTLEKNNFKKRF